MNDALKIKKLKEFIYIVPKKEIPDNVDDPVNYAQDAAIANDPNFSQDTEIKQIDTETVELCSACRKPTDRKVPVESGHDAPLCIECDDQNEVKA